MPVCINESGGSDDNMEINSNSWSMLSTCSCIRIWEDSGNRSPDKIIFTALATLNMSLKRGCFISLTHVTIFSCNSPMVAVGSLEVMEYPKYKHQISYTAESSRITQTWCVNFFSLPHLVYRNSIFMIIFNEIRANVPFVETAHRIVIRRCV